MPDANPNDFVLPDGRKIIQTTSSGVSVTVESTEQAGKGREADAVAGIAEIKLNCMRRGITARTINNPGPMIR